jgi:hypothetical protein
MPNVRQQLSSQDSALWSMIRSGIMAVSSILVGTGIAQQEQVDTLMNSLEVVVPGLIAIATVVWGVWVNWNTRRVPMLEAMRPDIETVSPITGAIEPSNKIMMPVSLVSENGTMPVGLVSTPAGRNYGAVRFPLTIPNWKLNMAYGNYIRPHWNKIPPATANKIANAVNGRTALTLTKQDFDRLPDAVWNQLQPYMSYLT